MQRRWLCSGECNIRVDLLLIYRLLAAISIAGIVAAARGEGMEVMYERRRVKPPSWRTSSGAWRDSSPSRGTGGVLALVGMWGYEHYEQLGWRDAFLNSAMLLAGMGPVTAPRTDAGKLFAGFYALYAGLVFLAVAGLLLAPVIHRVLHRFHWEAGTS